MREEVEFPEILSETTRNGNSNIAKDTKRMHGIMDTYKCTSVKLRLYSGRRYGRVPDARSNKQIQNLSNSHITAMEYEYDKYKVS